MARPSNKAQRRSEITQGLLTVIAAEGYHKASIQAISQAAGLAPGLIHYHFKNKQEILVALINNLADIHTKRYEELAASTHSDKDRIEAFFDASLALGKGSNTDIVAAWVVIGAEAIRQPEVKQIYQSIIAAHKKLLVDLFVCYLNSNDLNSGHLNSGLKHTNSGAPSGQLTAHDYQTTLDHLATMSLAAIEGAFQLATTADDMTPNNYAAPILKKMVFATLDHLTEPNG